MEEIAAAAGVGKGTLYRNFSGRGQLAEALLDDRSRALQSEALRRTSPAAGGDAADRLAAFLGMLLDFTADNVDLLCIAEGDGAEARSEQAYVWQRQVAAALLREGAAGRPEIDVDHLADALPSLVRPDLVRHQLEAVGLDRERIRAGLARLARAALA